MAEEDLPPEFRDAVAELLYHSQMIEGLLKAYLRDMDETANAHFAPKGFPFKPREIKKATLGALVKEYKRHSDVEWLAKRLEAFTRHRNTAAHEAFLWGFVHRESDERIKGAIGQVREQIAEAKVLVEAMTWETLRSYELKTGKDVSPPPVDMSP